MTETVDPMHPPPFPIGEPIGQKQNGPLSDHQMQALTFTFADHLRVKGELDNANDEIAELRVRLAETEAALKAMREHNDFLEDKLNVATIDRTRAIDERAEYAVRLDNIRRLVENPQWDSRGHSLRQNLEKPPQNSA